MDIEFEAKFINIDKDDVRSRLLLAGFELVHAERLMRRKVYAFPNIDYTRQFARVRDEGHVITMSVKRIDDRDSVDGVKESQKTVADFDQACAELERDGLTLKSYQETLREDWKRGTVDISLDTWPGLEPYVEVEAAGEYAVRAAAEELGFDYATAVFGLSTEVYALKYGYTTKEIMDMEVITFERPVGPKA